ELSPSSSSLSVSLGFGDQFLKLSSDSSLVSTVKDSIDADTTNLPPIPEIITKTLVTTTDPSPQVTPIISTVQQTTTLIPTLTITTDALTVTTAVPESNALTVVILRVVKLEKDVSKLKTYDHSSVALAFTIKSTDKASLEEYDLKSAVYQSMHANKSFNRNPANHQLYHALMEALIKDENTMDKGVVDTVKDHKRKLDDDEDDDDEDPC
ncbi:hypothetical protein Tco_0081851, partial [Tanacetum coccineum]